MIMIILHSNFPSSFFLHKLYKKMTPAKIEY